VHGHQLVIEYGDLKKESQGSGAFRPLAASRSPPSDRLFEQVSYRGAPRVIVVIETGGDDDGFHV
jgi:hypothetical protein